MINILSLTSPRETARLVEIVGDMPAGTRMSSTQSADEAKRKLGERNYDVIVLSDFYPEALKLLAEQARTGKELVFIDGHSVKLRGIAEGIGAKVFSSDETLGIRAYLLDIARAKHEEYARKKSSEKPLCPEREE